MRSSNTVIDAVLGLATLAGRAWMLVPPGGGVTVTRNVPYGPLPRHRLDVYSPARPRGIRLLYIHGGSFRCCSKESHSYVGRALAQAGVHVYSIDYGLAPAFPYPVAHLDALAAYRWLLAGPGRDSTVVTAGDSAGANVALSIAVACAGGLEDAAAAEGLRVPDAVACLSGLLGVRGRADAYRDNAVVHARLAQIEADFLDGCADAPLAEPLRAIEAGGTWTERLPPVFIAVGDQDGIAHDSHALADRLPAESHELRIYAEQGHAFMISPFRAASARCWADLVAFLDRFFGAESGT
jgi:acetyl esterase/lipase